jgi:hypothetical protein
MDLTELPNVLRDAQVPDSAYVIRRGFGRLRRPRGGTWCVEKAGGDWQVYQWVDDAKLHLTTTTTETAACDVLLGELGFGYLIDGVRTERPGSPSE